MSCCMPPIFDLRLTPMRKVTHERSSSDWLAMFRVLVRGTSVALSGTICAGLSMPATSKLRLAPMRSTSHDIRRTAAG